MVCCLALLFCDCQWSWIFCISFIWLSIMVLWQLQKGASHTSYYRSVTELGPEIQHFEIHCSIYAEATPPMGCFSPMTVWWSLKGRPILGRHRTLFQLIFVSWTLLCLSDPPLEYQVVCNLSPHLWWTSGPAQLALHFLSHRQFP